MHARQPRDQTLVPIVTFHAIGTAPSPLWLSADRLEALLVAFARAGYRGLTLGALAAAMGRGEPLPERALVLTFDDGYASVLHQALPRLAAHGFTATVFLLSGRCGKDNRWPGQPASVPVAPLLGWRDAAALGAAGWELAAHGRSHRPLVDLPAAEIEEEVAGCCADIARHLGTRPRTFAYPYGATTPDVVNIVRRHVDAAVGVQLGLADDRSDRYLLPRIDAYYLRPAMIPHLDRAGFRRYLGLRQRIRGLRRRQHPDWHLDWRRASGGDPHG